MLFPLLWGLVMSNVHASVKTYKMCEYNFNGIKYDCYKRVENNNMMLESREATVTRAIGDITIGDIISYYAVVMGRIPPNMWVVIEPVVTVDDIEYTVEQIDPLAFRNDDGLHSIIIPSTVWSIPEKAFMDCLSLEEVELTESISDIFSAAFKDCTSLKKVTIRRDAVASARSYNAPKGVVHISSRTLGESAFEGCRNLTSVDLPSILETVRNRAFYGCAQLKSVSFVSTQPASVVIPANNNVHELFAGCTGITDVYVNSNYGICDDVFDEYTYKHAVLHCPTDKKETYKNLSGWKNFLCLYDDTPEDEQGDLNGDGQVNGTDLVALVSIVLEQQSGNNAADVNGDGQVNGTDLVALVNKILSAGNSRIVAPQIKKIEPKKIDR